MQDGCHVYNNEEQMFDVCPLSALRPSGSYEQVGLDVYTRLLSEAGHHLGG